MHVAGSDKLVQEQQFRTAALRGSQHGGGVGGTRMGLGDSSEGSDIQVVLLGRGLGVLERRAVVVSVAAGCEWAVGEGEEGGWGGERAAG